VPWIAGAEGCRKCSSPIDRRQGVVAHPARVRPARASDRPKKLFETDPPYGAHVTFELGQNAAGWSAPALKPWLEESVERASGTFFGKKVAYMGEGGSIPFMDMLGKRYPEAQFLITGVLGPNSNAHGPNEFLHLPTERSLLLHRPCACRSLQKKIEGENLSLLSRLQGASCSRKAGSKFHSKFFNL
jgi:hypothetical protein